VRNPKEQKELDKVLDLPERFEDYKNSVLIPPTTLNRPAIRIPCAANRQDGSEMFGEEPLIDLQINKSIDMEATAPPVRTLKSLYLDIMNTEQ